MALPDNLQYLIQALRTPASPASTTPQTGPDAGTTRTTSSLESPIGTRRDGYRLYLQDHKAGNQGDGDPMSYEEWISKEQ